MFKFDKYSARSWKYIIIHHSWSPDSETAYDWDAIAKYHVIDRGWACIGYHFGVELGDDGKYHYCIGRGLDCMGAHTIGMNDKAIGICLIGKYDEVAPLDCQYYMLGELCRDLMRDFNIPIENVQRHSQYADKSCPGKRFDMEKLYEKIRHDGFQPPYTREATS